MTRFCGLHLLGMHKEYTPASTLAQEEDSEDSSKDHAYHGRHVHSEEFVRHKSHMLQTNQAVYPLAPTFSLDTDCSPSFESCV